MNKLNINSKITLNNGTKMPVIGFGTFQIPEGEEVFNSVKWALEAGYRMIDTAMTYQNEEGVGSAIRESGISREEIFVTTKLWNTDQGYENTLKAIEVSLAKLGLSYVDLYLIHFPSASEDRNITIDKRKETWKAMEEIYQKGLAKAIGVSNFTIKHLSEMKNYAKVMPTVDQVEFHPFLYQEELLNYCKKNNIVLEAYRSLTGAKKLPNTVIENISKKYGRTDAQILIRWALQHGCVSIPKSVHKERIIENLNVFDFELKDEDMKTLNDLNENLHLSWDPTNIT